MALMRPVLTAKDTHAMRHGSVVQCQEVINDLNECNEHRVSNDTILHGLENPDINLTLAILDSTIYRDNNNNPRTFDLSPEQEDMLINHPNLNVVTAITESGLSLALRTRALNRLENLWQ